MTQITRQHNAASHRWYRIELNAAQVADLEHEQLRHLFDRLYLSEGRPHGMSLWMRHRSDGGADLYFSPACRPVVEDLIQRYDGRICLVPGQSSTHMAGCRRTDTDRDRGSAVHRSKNGRSDFRLSPRRSARISGSVLSASSLMPQHWPGTGDAPLLSRVAPPPHPRGHRKPES